MSRVSGAGTPEIAAAWSQAASQSPASATALHAMIQRAVADGVSSEELAWAEQLVSQLENNAPNADGVAGFLRRTFTASVENHQAHLDNARQIVQTFRDHRQQAETVQQGIGTPPAHLQTADQFRAYFAQALTTMSDNGQVRLPPEPGLGDGSREGIRGAARAWNAAGEGDDFSALLTAYAQHAAFLYPADDPRHAEALAGAYAAFTQQFFVHAATSQGVEAFAGNRPMSIPWAEFGVANTTTPDWVALFSFPSRDGRAAIDCEGFAHLAQRFFTAAGHGDDFRLAESHPPGRPASPLRHKLGFAQIGNTTVVTSNGQAATFADRRSPEISAFSGATGGREFTGITINPHPPPPLQ